MSRPLGPGGVSAQQRTFDPYLPVFQKGRNIGRKAVSDLQYASCGHKALVPLRPPCGANWSS